MLNKLISLHNSAFNKLEKATGDQFLSLFARFIFLAVLCFYYLNSASLKVEEGFVGFFTPSFSAYIQILSESTLTAYDFEAENLPFFLKLIVYLGTYMEFLLPILIVLGLFSRLAALGMIAFVIVQSFVDYAFHEVDPQTFGAWFDTDSASLILDQRLLWVFLLTVIVIKGGGALSLDNLLSRQFAPTANQMENN